MQLKDIPASEKPVLITPLCGTTNAIKNEIRRGKHPGVVREMIRITGCASDYVHALKPHRQRIARLQADTGCNVTLFVNPWWVINSTPMRFTKPNDYMAWGKQIGGIISHVRRWTAAGVKISDVFVGDEACVITPKNREDVYRRTIELYRALTDATGARITWYNARQVAFGRMFQWVHEFTPGISSMSMYQSSEDINYRILRETRALSEDLGRGVPVGAWVQLCSLRAGDKWAPKKDRKFYWHMGECLNVEDIEFVALNQTRILDARGENEWVVENLDGFIRGFNILQ